MSELTIAEALLKSIQQQARKEGFSRVKHIYLEIGRLSDITPEAMRLCLEGILKNTLAENAKVSIEEAEAKALCLSCGHTNNISNEYSACDDCGSFDLKLLTGDQVKIRHLDVV